MAGYANGGMFTGSSGASTGSVLNASAYDRLLVLHANAVTANTLILWKLGSSLSAYSTTLGIPANTPYDTATYFFGSTESLLGGWSASSGSIIIDELRL